MIESKNYEGALCTLVDAKGLPVAEGTVIADKWGDSWTVNGGRAPQSTGSTGHVWVTHATEEFNRTFYVGVLGLWWAVKPSSTFKET